jgi:hypothetical protein
VHTAIKYGDDLRTKKKMQSLDMDFDTYSDTEGEDRAFLPTREVPAPATTFWAKLSSPPTKADGDAPAAAVSVPARLSRCGRSLLGRLRPRDQAVVVAIALGAFGWAGLAAVTWLVGFLGWALRLTTTPSGGAAPPSPVVDSGGNGWETRGSPSPAPTWFDREDPGLFGGGWQVGDCHRGQGLILLSSRRAKTRSVPTDSPFKKTAVSTAYN